MVLEGRMDGQGGTKKGTGWYGHSSGARVGPTSYRPPVPPKVRDPSLVPPSTTGTPSRRTAPETTMRFAVERRSRVMLPLPFWAHSDYTRPGGRPDGPQRSSERCS